MAEKTNIVPLHSEDDEFELLAAEALCDELTPEREERLKVILAGSADKRRRFRELTETGLMFASIPPGRIAEADSETKRSSDSSGKKISSTGKRPVRIAFAVAAGLLFTIGIAALFVSRSRPVDGIVEVQGSCTANGKVGASGQKENLEVIQTGAASYCDAKLASSGEVNLRLFPESRVRVTRTENSTIVIVDAGGIILDAGKRKSELIVRAKNTAVELLGTKIAVTTGQNGVQVSVLAGRTRISADPALADPASERMSSGEIEKTLRSGKNTQTAVVETGQTAEIKGTASPIRVENTEPETRFLLLRAQSGFVEMPRSLEKESALEAMGDARKQTPPVLYRLHLKNGSIVTGRVEQKGNQYRVMTEEKDITVDQDQVENLELFQKD